MVFCRWAQLLNEATSNQSTMDSWLDISAHNVGLPALSIRNVDCQGFIYKEGGNYKSWKRRYAVLKDGCLYYYCDIDSRSAQGRIYLSSYLVWYKKGVILVILVKYFEPGSCLSFNFVMSVSDDSSF